MSKYIKLVIVVLILNSINLLSVEKLLHPYNLNFELDVESALPEGWYMPTQYEAMGYVGLGDTMAYSGKYSLMLMLPKGKNPKNKGIVFQSIDANDYVNQEVVFKAYLKPDDFTDSTQSHIWIKVHNMDGTIEKFVQSDSLIKKNKGWTLFEVKAKIGSKASTINFGVSLQNSGFVYMDKASFSFNNIDKEGIDIDYHPLTKQAVSNLVAFAKIYGVARYFYPGFEASKNNWERFALDGVGLVEKARSNAELKDNLMNLYLPITPTLEIKYLNQKINLKKEKKPANAIDKIALAWLHIGAELGIPIKHFLSVVRNLYLPQRQREAPVIQYIDALKLRGKKIKLSVYAKAKVLLPAGQAQIWLGIDNGEGKISVMETNSDQPIIRNRWQRYSISAVVPEKAKVIRIGLALFGEGTVLFDNVKLTNLDDKKDHNNYARNSGFELGKNNVLKGWKLPKSSIKAGYTAILSKKKAYKGKQCLQIISDINTKITMPEIGEKYTDSLNDSLRFIIPLTVYADSNTTLPIPNFKKIKSNKPDNFVYKSNDRQSRFAVVTILWNIFRHFGLNINPKTNWDEILTTTFTKVAVDSNENEFVNSLNWLLAQINDGQAKAWTNKEDYLFGIPLLWKWIGNKLIVYKTDNPAKDIPIGSEILSINDVEIHKLTNKFKERISAKTQQWANIRASAEMRAGSEGSQLKLNIKTPKGEIKNFVLKRSVLLSELSDSRPPKFYVIQDGFYYLDLSTITDRGFKNLVKDLKKKFTEAKGFIFDARGNSDLSPDFLGMFLPNTVKSVSRKIPVFTKPGDKPSVFFTIPSEITAKNPSIKANILFLTDERTSGNAEIIVALAKYYNIGVLLGTKTSGTANEVFGINLPGNFNASIVSMLVEMPDQKINLNSGVQPDMEIKPTIKGIINGKDEILEAVYELINGDKGKK